MRDSRFEEPLSDAALDCEIERLMGVEPSPHFVHRVRARVAAAEAAPSAHGWRPAWAVAAASIAAGLVAAYLAAPFESDRMPGAPGGVAMNGDPGREIAGVRDRRSEGLRLPLASDEGALRPEVPGRRPRERGRTPIAASDPPLFMPVTSDELILPPVLIAADERRALELMLVLRPEPEAQMREAEPGQATAVADLPSLAEIEVPELDIAPLAQIATFEGGRP